MKKIKIEFSKKQNAFKLENIYEEIFKKILYLNKTFLSFKDKNNVLFFRKEEDGEIWKKAIYNKETEKIEEHTGIKISYEKIFKEKLKDLEMTKQIPFTYLQIIERTKKELENLYKENETKKLIITILYFLQIEKKEELLISETDKTEENKNLIEKINKLETREEQIKYLKEQSKKKITEKLLESFIKKIYKQDIKTINKINSYFDNRVQLPGKYLIKHNELILNALLREQTKKEKKEEKQKEEE